MEDEFEELKKIEQIAKPLIDFIKQNYNPHTSIVINEDSIKVVTDEINIPLSEELTNCRFIYNTSLSTN